MTVRTIPSLVVGLGGTGKRALTHLKRRVFDTYRRADLPWIRLLSIDTDDATVNNPPVVSQLTGEYIQLASSETRIIDQSDTPKVIANLEAPENRHIREWYPDPERQVDFPKAARGSGQVRMFGRVGLYKGDNLANVYRWLQQCAHEVSDPAAWDEFRGFSVDPSLQFVYVICSLCGGTGSGMFLDIAYMLRKVVGVDPSTRRFIGMFVLPEVYEPVVETQHIKRIYANTYAALRELDFLMNSPRRSYTVRGKDHTFADFERDVPPFDFVFLFSNKNKRGAVISQRQVSGEKPVATDDRVSQYIAETIITDVLSPVTERSESILSNIFTSISEPEQMEDRTFYKTYSSVGVSSVKIPPPEHFRELMQSRMMAAVIDFLLRPDPDITEKNLARQFFSERLDKVENRLIVRGSLSQDDAYGRYLSRQFFDEFRVDRPKRLNSITQWVESALSHTIDPNNVLDPEKEPVAALKLAQDQAAAALDAAIKDYVKDPQRGYAFICEWVEELIALARAKLYQVPPPRKFEGDPRRQTLEALDSLKRIAPDIQLPVLTDTVEVLMERLAEYYDNVGRNERSHNLMRQLYASLIDLFEAYHGSLKGLVTAIQELDDCYSQSYNSRVAEMSDATEERVLIDKSLVGRREIDRFLSFLLSPIWEDEDWRTSVPALAEKIKARIDAELSYRLMEIALDKTLDEQRKKETIEQEVRAFVCDRLFNELYPVDPATGRLRQPTFTDSDGRSILFDLAPDNLLSLMLAHSSPLWFVQTHQVGSATSPITFLGLNGTKIAPSLLAELQRHLPTFRPTDVVLSDAEARILIKQYDPLYSLASLVSIIDYENYYKDTDRNLNPMHTDLRFVREPNPFLQYLTYRAPEPPPLKVCAEGHDITRALSEARQFCPHCARDGIKTFIIPGKMLCPKCARVIDKDNRKCPECLALLEAKKEKCPGCLTRGAETPQMMTVAEAAQASLEVSCPTCGSLWANLCPYCNTPLENPTMCTRGSDRCIFESPPIALCAGCGCSVTPDTGKCPRCLRELRECKNCRDNNQPRRMIPVEFAQCPTCAGAYQAQAV